jgi:tetratricopeptide (TPR) repeat protein
MGLKIVAPLAVVLAFLSYEQASYWRDGMTLFTRSVEVNPESWFLNHNLGEAYHRQNQLDKAQFHYEKTVKTRPLYTDARFNLALVYNAKGKYSEAYEQLVEAAKVRPYDFETTLLRAVVLDEMGRRPESIEELRKAESTFSDPNQSERIRFQMAKTLATSGDRNGAAQYYEKVIQANPKHPEAHHNLGVIFAEQSKFDLATTHLQKAVELFPGFVLAHFNLGLVHMNTGRKQDAEKEFRQVLALDAGNNGAKQYLQMLGTSGGAANAH